MRWLAVARRFAHSLRLASGIEYSQWWRQHRPSDLPSHPHSFYGDEWISWGDWLGTDVIATTRRKFKDFASARAYVRSLKMKSIVQWNEWASSGKRPVDLPSNPDKLYASHWMGWHDWLGPSHQGKFADWRSFADARAYVRTLGIKSKD